MKINVDEMQCRMRFRDQCKEKDLSLKHKVLQKNPHYQQQKTIKALRKLMTYKLLL